MSIEEFYEKRLKKQFDEAKTLALHYKKRFSKNPPIEVFSEYFMLFCNAEQALKIPVFKAQMETNNNFDEVRDHMKNNPPRFDSYEAFLDECYK